MTKAIRNFEKKLPFEKPYQAQIHTMISPTHGEMTLEEMCDRIETYIKENNYENSNYTIAIGTDSQNFKSTKVVAAVALYCEGHGGIYFYKVLKFPKLPIHEKILNETVISINLAEKITPILEEKKILDNANFQIHCDIGHNGKTNKYISEITGMIKACDYDCVIKPDSFVASGIANKYSK